jgi:hypothetical protein
MPNIDQRNIDANAVVIGPAGNAGVLQSVGMPTGTILVGKTGSPPVAATIGSSDGSVDITGGAGTIDIVVDPAVKDKAITSADGSVDLVTGSSTVDLSVDPTLRDKAISSPDGSVVVTAGPSTVTLAVAAAIRDKAIDSADHSVAVTTTGTVDLSVPRPHNFTFNGNFEIWGGGTSAAPTGWTLSGAGATVAKDTGHWKIGTASVALTRVGTDCFLFQDVGVIYPPVSFWQGQTVTVGAWVYATVANVARIAVSDNVVINNSAYHSGSGAMEFLTATVTLSNAPVNVRIYLLAATTNTTVAFDGVIFVMGGAVSGWVPSGWRGRKAVMTLSSGVTTLTTNPAYYGVGGGGATDFQYFAMTPFKGVARNLFASRSGTPATTPTDTLRVYNLSAAVDTALSTSFGVSANFTAGDLTHEVELGKGWPFEIKTLETGGVAHTACFEFEEIP